MESKSECASSPVTYNRFNLNLRMFKNISESRIVPLLASLCLSGCSAIPQEITDLAKEQPILAVAAGVTLGALTVVSGGAALIGVGVAGAGVTAAYGIEKKMGANLDTMIAEGDCEGVKAFADKNYYSPMQRKSVLERACKKHSSSSPSAARSITATNNVVAGEQKQDSNDTSRIRATASSPSMLNDIKKPSKQTVVSAQKKLVELGFLSASPNGNLGPKTEEAIKKFQSSSALQPTGFLDDQTVLALQEAQRRLPQNEGLKIDKDSDSKPAPKPGAPKKSLDSL